MSRIRTFFLFFFLGIAIAAGAQQAGNRPIRTLYFIGDAGEPDIRSSSIGSVIQRLAQKEKGSVSIVFLGDNIYPKGMPAPDERLRGLSEEIIRTQALWVDGLDAAGIFIPGNHDWGRGEKFGYQRILNQEAFLDSLQIPNLKMLPGNGCPGPVEIPISDQVTLVIIDSQWILHPWEKPGEEGSCDVKTGSEFALAIDDLFARNADKRVILAAHHPLVSYGEHGGYFTWKDHIFPLTHVEKDFYLPLPVIGSIFPLYRKWFGNVQDLAHPLYRVYSASLSRLMAQYPGSIQVAGHEHNMQYVVRDSSYLVVTGSGSKSSHVAENKGAQYAASLKGFVRMRIFADGGVDVQFWNVDEDNPVGEVVFSDTLAAPSRLSAEPEDADNFTLADSLVKVRASDQYGATPLRERMLGGNYRKEWYQSLNAPVFDIGTERAGLTIVKKGGGMQTLSLRLEDAEGKEYSLRSVEKYPEAAVPEIFRKTFAQDLVQDQISASHPYGALIVPPLAEAAGIYHTNPRLVFVPDDPRLGIYRKTFGNKLALFEERPAGDWSEAAYFGESESIIGTDDLLEELEDDNDNQVDQPFVVKSRLFDMLIGDWDRHDDQWRWASFEKKKGELYRPIPRDRDQAFFLNEGFFPRIWSRKWSLPKFEGFNDEIRWPSGFSFNARYFDRSFMNEPDREVWMENARQLQQSLTDSVIENAVREWPAEIFDLHGDVIIRKLKTRRDKLVETAVSHYEFLAREVDVVMSDKHEEFLVERRDDGNVNVTVYKTSKEGARDKVIYQRVFMRGETREVRLYGRGGDDRFTIRGDASRSILIRAIGGGGDDIMDDLSTVGGLGKCTYFYDFKKGATVAENAGEVRDLTSNNPAVNAYDRRAFQYDRMAPVVFGAFNPDDGLFIGGGFLNENHGFRKYPFRQRHLFMASIAPRTNSFNVLYRGDFTEVIKRWNLEINADFKVPNYVNNFFGWGNESIFDQDIDEEPGINAPDAIDYYRFRFEEIRVEAFLTRNISRQSVFRIGPAYQRIELEEPDDIDRFVYEYAETLPYDLFTEFNSFAGFAWSLKVNQRDNAVVTRRGIEATIGGRTMAGVRDVDQNFSSFNGAVSFFHTFQYPGRVVFALRAGAGHTTGRYEFYQAQILDGRTELRGFRKTRFYGDTKFYTNLEVRLKLANFRTYLFPVSVGLLGFHDVGRVWYKDASGIDPTAPSGKSSAWHRSWGGGLWFTPFNITVLSAEVGHSDEGTLFYLRLGYLF